MPVVANRSGTPVGVFMTDWVCIPMGIPWLQWIDASEAAVWYMFAHACGQLKALAPLILEAGLNCVEGQAHPPIGDWRLAETRALSDRLIVCGGMTSQEQEWSGVAAACLSCRPRNYGS